VPRLTWEETSRIVGAFDTHDSVGRFLVEELTTYLREGGLMEPPALTTDHLIALANHGAALQTILRVCELADLQMGERWGNHTAADRYPTMGTPRQYWWLHRRTASDGSANVNLPRGLDLFRMLLLDSSELLVDGRPKVPVLVAGLSGTKGSVTRLKPVVRDRLETGGFSLIPAGSTPSRRDDYAVQIRYPDQFFGGGEVARQAALLADWIHAAFLSVAKATAA
jgi:hypothetical protein